MFKGVGTALITPFDKDGGVDYEALRHLIAFQIAGGVDALVVLGTTGEAPSVTGEERKRIIEIAVTETRRRLPVIVGTGTNCLESVLHYNALAEELGADGVLIVTPYYNKGTQESICQFYKFIAERTKLPVILYNVPTRTGFNLLPETAFRIFRDCANVIGIKEANADFAQVTKLLAGRPDGMLVFSGNDDITLPFMALGAEGVVSVASNVIPSEMKALTTYMADGELAKAREIQNRWLNFFSAMFVEVNPVPVKYAAARMGLCKNILRLPLMPISEKNATILTNLMRSRGLL
jgi:4-hydroxy-tetrahydrodipicolinate synthase